MEKLADLLAAVTDEKTAAEVKPKLDNLFDEGRAARTQVFTTLAAPNGTDEQAAATLTRLTERLTAASGKVGKEFDRIARDHKTAYKTLRDAKLFAELEKDREEKAVKQARELVDSVRVYRQNGGKQVVNLSDLTSDPEVAKKYLLDPWGFPFQYQPGEKRAYVWTVSPYSGQKLGSPPPEEK